MKLLVPTKSGDINVRVKRVGKVCIANWTRTSAQPRLAATEERVQTRILGCLTASVHRDTRGRCAGLILMIARPRPALEKPVAEIVSTGIYARAHAVLLG